MNSRLGWILFVCFVAFGVVGVAMAADPAPAASGTGTGTGAAAAGPAPLPTPPMNLTTEGALPPTFRGGNPDTGLIHVLEDYPYKRAEHTILYQDDASAIAPGAKFVGEPTINWTTEETDANGNVIPGTPAINENTNQATNCSEFPNPGYYRVGNGGARQVSGGASDDAGNGGATGDNGGAANGDGGAATGNGNGGATGDNGGAANGNGGAATGNGNGGATGDNGGAANGAGGAANGNGTQAVTANQTMGVQAHDCTPPNLWAVVQEGGGSTNLAANDDALKNEVKMQMVSTLVFAKGSKQSLDPTAIKLTGNLANASLFALYEDPPNAKPKEKTTRVIVEGPMFDKEGRKVRSEETVVPATLLDEANQTRVAVAKKLIMKAGETEEQALKNGIFVRRNVPFLMAAVQTDNGEFSSKDANCFVVKAGNDTDPIQKVDNAYLFRRPNFPRAEFKDEPEYTFIMQGVDKEGNRTEVRVPLYVVDTQASIEAGQAH